MKELIERLRAGSGGMSHWMELEREAADAIERLENEASELTSQIAACRDATPEGYADDALSWAMANPDGVAEYVKAAFVQMQNENLAYDIRMNNDAADLAAERLYSTQAMQAVEDMAAERDELRAELEKAKLHIKHIGNDALRAENAELRDELAKLKQQTPFAYIRKDHLRNALPGGFLCEVTATPRPDCVGFYLVTGASHDKK